MLASTRPNGGSPSSSSQPSQRKFGSIYVYHEKQISALCGVHCLNALFQEPIFDEVMLAKLAHELDEKERHLMLECGDSAKEFLQYMSEDSGNVSDDGNFSIQVLQGALYTKGLECVLLTAANYPPIFNTLHKQHAFICNRGSHWYTIRKIDAAMKEGEDDFRWYDLNSFSDGPKFIPELVLGDTLKLLIAEGHSIYLVQGQLPSPAKTRNYSVYGGSWTRVKGSDEDDLEMALQLSLQQQSERASSPLAQRTNPAPPISSLYPQAYPNSSEFRNETPPAYAPQHSSYSQPVTQYYAVETNGKPVEMMQQLFGKCLSRMDQLNSRLLTLEKSLESIHQHQH
eukprot:TRINITY_DN815_c0_g1_i1.p1 TRINITY_DN815_c0_g1~~TRINITY_DN815_c0_g1_i1.p1  ORF type:complete len:341 (-),score=49.02 TRINITY_DN815_c0_g1_i1:21-1043(-)